MKNLIKNNINILFTFVTVCFSVYYLLIKDTFWHTSISSIINQSQDFEVTTHLLVLGLLPVYIATVIFGGAILGSFLGSALAHFIFRK